MATLKPVHALNGRESRSHKQCGSGYGTQNDKPPDKIHEILSTPEEACASLEARSRTVFQLEVAIILRVM
jgi:hypothetical protein